MIKYFKVSMLILAFSVVVVLFMPNKAHALTAVAKGPYTWVGPHGIPNTAAYIEIDGHVVFCIDPHKNAPYGGQSYEMSKYDDKGLRSILYYGYGGYGNEIGNSMEAYIKTHFALSNWVHGKREKNDSYINEDPDVWRLLQHAKKQDVPSTKFSFNKSKVVSKVSGNVQKSETIKFNGDKKNSVKISVPKKVTIHVGAKSQTGGTYKLNGGDSFYFTAPLDYDESFKSGSLSGEMYTFAGLLYMPKKDYQRLLNGKFVLDPAVTDGFTVAFEKRQRNITILHKDKFDNSLLEEEKYKKDIGSNYKYSTKNEIKKGAKTFVPVKQETKTGVLQNKDVTLTFYYKLQRKITVLHKDNRDGKLLRKEEFLKNRGDKYSYSPAKDLKKGEYTYRPVSNEKITGAVNSENITINFYYDVPLMKVGLEKLQIFTNNADKGLPVKIFLAKNENYPPSTKGFASSKIDIALYQSKTKLASKTYSAKDFPETLNMKIPVEGLKVNQSKSYTVKFENFSKFDFDVPKQLSSLTTKGYTSAEKTIELDIKKTIKGYESSYVVMTEITPSTTMKSFFETYGINGNALINQKTGYGLEQEMKYKYTNQIGKDDEKAEFNFNVPSQLIDSYLEYKEKDGNSIVPMEKVVDKVQTIKESSVRETTFSFPHVNVEKETGRLFSDEQVEKKDKRQKYKLIDGGRKFYTPIWSDLKEYKVFHLTNTLGVNDVRFKVTDSIRLDAYMYSHMDSSTKGRDEILLMPINSDEPFPNGIPKGWTKQDVEWLKK